MTTRDRLLAAFPILADLHRPASTVTVPAPRPPWPHAGNVVRLERLGLRGRSLAAFLACGHVVAVPFWTPWAALRSQCCHVHHLRGVSLYVAPPH